MAGNSLLTRLRRLDRADDLLTLHLVDPVTETPTPIVLDRATLYQGNSLDILPLLEPEQSTACVCDSLCGGPHNESSVAQAVMWPSSFLWPYFSISPIFRAT